MSFATDLKRAESLLFVPICRVCGERQSIFVPELPLPLCPACAGQWAQCMEASEMPHASIDMPDALRDAGCSAWVHLSVYRAGAHGVTERLILRCKDVNDRALFGYLAADLVLPAFRAAHAVGASLENVVVTYAPRRRGTALTVGHDQARELSRALARRLGCRWKRTIRRHGHRQRQQKELSAKERLRNARRGYRLVPITDIKGKTVLLVDDVCTTGATLSACTRLLLDGGATHVIAVCVAVSENHG